MTFKVEEGATEGDEEDRARTHNRDGGEERKTHDILTLSLSHVL